MWGIIILINSKAIINMKKQTKQFSVQTYTLIQNHWHPSRIHSGVQNSETELKVCVFRILKNAMQRRDKNTKEGKNSCK